MHISTYIYIYIYICPTPTSNTDHQNSQDTKGRSPEPTGSSRTLQCFQAADYAPQSGNTKEFESSRRLKRRTFGLLRVLVI